MTALPKVVEAMQAGEAPLLVVSFLVAGQLCGLPASIVRDVLGPQPITPVPLSRPEIAGNLNIRGRIVTAIDLRVRLGFGMHGLVDTTTALAVVMDYGKDVYALLVDRVLEVIALNSRAVTDLPPNLAPAWSTFGRGVCRTNDGWLIMLDVDSLLPMPPPAG